MKFILPWPHKDLLPNARVHWARKAKRAKMYKNDCIICIQGSTDRKDLRGASRFIVTFRAPDNRKRDTDGMVGAFKHGFDAISHVSGVDDSKFEWTAIRGEPVSGGQVVVEVLR